MLVFRSESIVRDNQNPLAQQDVGRGVLATARCDKQDIRVRILIVRLLIGRIYVTCDMRT